MALVVGWRKWTKHRGGAWRSNAKECYRRSDVECGLLQSDVVASSSLASIGRRMLVLDTNILLREIDLIEQAALGGVVVVTQTAFEELRHLDRSILDRLISFLSASRSAIVLANEHCDGCFIEPLADESPNDRNDRAIRAAASYLAQFHPAVLLVSDDADNRAKSGVRALTCRDLCEQLDREDGGHRCDLLSSSTSSEDSSSSRKLLYEAHVTMSELAERVAMGDAKQGVFRSSRSSPWRGIVLFDQGGEAIRVDGPEAVNRAVDGDVVIVVVQQQQQHASPQADASSVPVEDDGEEGGAVQMAPEIEDHEEQSSSLMKAGRIIGIVRRHWRASYAGSLEHDDLFVPADKRIPKVRIETRQAKRLRNMRLLVAIDEWPADSRYPRGHYVGTLGEAGSKEVETMLTLHEHAIEAGDFSAAAMACLPVVDRENSFEIPFDEVERRLDLRDTALICSIDPPNCRDIDDALHVEETNTDSYIVGVHIADVTHFCQSGTALDEEAKRRGTSTYLVDRRLDMLPSLLTEHVCSLKAGVDRLAFSVLIELDKHTCEVKSSRFVKTVIRSRAALSYHEAQLMIAAPSAEGPLATSVRLLAAIARRLRAQRIAAGALTLASPEVRFELCNESDSPTDVGAYKLVEANATVEEFMLLANVCVAKRILEDQRPAILRHHPPPPRHNFEPLNRKLRFVGKPPLDPSCSKSLADSLNAVGNNDPDLDKLVRVCATRCMAPANYFKSSDSSEWRHFGLAADVYTHFTSPIRRYADVLAHRQLSAAVFGWSDNQTDLAATCAHLNRKNKNAQYAARDSIALYTRLYFKDKPPERQQARVVDITRRGRRQSISLVVLIQRYGLEAAITLPQDTLATAKDDDDILAVTMPPSSPCGDLVINIFDTVHVVIQLKRRKHRHGEEDQEDDESVDALDALHVELASLHRSPDDSKAALPKLPATNTARDAPGTELRQNEPARVAQAVASQAGQLRLTTRHAKAAASRHAPRTGATGRTANTKSKMRLALERIRVAKRRRREDITVK